MNIPIRNLYLLLVYAWDIVHETEKSQISIEESDVPLDLYAKLLFPSLEQLLRNGIDKGYVEHCLRIPGIRGKINITQSIPLLAQRDGTLVCEFDEYSPDVQHNQILKATLNCLIQIDELNNKHVASARKLLSQFSEVSLVQIQRNSFRRVQLHSNISHYRFLLSVCELIYLNTLADEQSGRFRFRAFSDEQMGKVFERFVLRYLKRHLDSTQFNVKAEEIKWQASTLVDSEVVRLPRMMTDALITFGNLRLVVDTKFYGKPFIQHHYRTEQDSVRSAHLYQMLAYVKNLDDQHNGETRGLLLYAQVGQQVTYASEILGLPVIVATLDLTLPSDEIGMRLVELVEIACGPVQRLQKMSLSRTNILASAS